MTAVLDGERFQSGWGVDGFCAWGGADDSIHPRRVVDHATTARNRLILFYQDKPNMLALIDALSESFQTLEDAGQACLQTRGLDGSGSALDGYGDLYSFQRQGQADNGYRALLQAAAAAGASDATPDAVRSVLDLLMSGTEFVTLREDPPGATVLQTYELQQPDGAAFAKLVQRAVPLATRAVVEFEVPTYVGASIGWESDNSGGPFAEWGADPTPAGLWAEASDGR